MLAIRAPFSALGGALLSVGLFIGLAKLVNVPFEIADRAPVPPPFTFKAPRPDTPVQPTRDDKLKYEPPQLQPRPPGGIGGDGSVNVRPIKYTQPTLGERPRLDRGLRRFDGDVTRVLQVPPEYPPSAIAGNIQGWVRVRFTVTAIGTVRDAVVVDSEPGTVFDDAALKAIARWRFNPRVEDGEAVERVGLQYLFRFELEN